MICICQATAETLTDKPSVSPSDKMREIIVTKTIRAAESRCGELIFQTDKEMCETREHKVSGNESVFDQD